MGECNSMPDREKRIMEIQDMAKRMRKKVLDMALTAGASSSHFGGGLSIVDITATLYGAIMKLDPKNPKWREIAEEGRNYTINNLTNDIAANSLVNLFKEYVIN